MLAWALTIALVLLGLSLIFCAYRVVVGPTTLDRTAAFDTFSVNLTGVIAVWAIDGNTTLHFDLAFMIALVPFMFAVIVAKSIVKGDIIDRDSD